MKVFAVVGNRPRFIKSAPLSAALRAAGDRRGRPAYRAALGTTCCPEVFFDQLGLAEPRYRLEPALRRPRRRWSRRSRSGSRPSRLDLVLVYGDTNSTVAGARAAAASRPIPRPRRGWAAEPRPHECPRNTTGSRPTPLLAPLCPDDRSEDNAGRRACPRPDLRRRRRDGRREPNLHDRSPGLAFPVSVRAAAPTSSRRSTARQTSNSHGSAGSSRGLNGIDEPVVFPVHPRTRSASESEGLKACGGHVRVIEPLGYLELASLASQARVDRH